MRGKRAKLIRRMVDGDPIPHDEQKYRRFLNTGQIICLGARSEYKKLKKGYKT